jgi:hypothetical protein
MKKNILIIVSAFILFGFSFALSSCKKCSKDNPIDRGGNTSNTPSDTTMSSNTIDGNSKIRDGLNTNGASDGKNGSTPLGSTGGENGKKTISHPLTKKQQLQADLAETAKLAKKAYDVADVVGTMDADADDEVHKKEASNNAATKAKEASNGEGSEQCGNEGGMWQRRRRNWRKRRKTQEGMRLSQKIKNRAKAIELLAKFARLQAVRAAYYAERKGKTNGDVGASARRAVEEFSSVLAQADKVVLGLAKAKYKEAGGEGEIGGFFVPPPDDRWNCWDRIRALDQDNTNTQYDY